MDSELEKHLIEIDSSHELTPRNKEERDLLLSRVDTAIGQFAELVGPFERFCNQNSQSFVQYKRCACDAEDNYRLALSLSFSHWGNLVCISANSDLLSPPVYSAIVNEGPEILRGSGFFPVFFEEIDFLYSGMVMKNFWGTWFFRYFAVW